MTRTYCDCCGCDIVDSSMENLIGSRKFVVIDANSPDNTEFKLELTLCAKCKKTFYYLVQNPAAFRSERNSMRLRNRIRFLFKRPVKEG